MKVNYRCFKKVLSDKTDSRTVSKNVKPFIVKGLTVFIADFSENIFKKMKVFSFKDFVKFFHFAIAFCAVYHYHENVFSEMS